MKHFIIKKELSRNETFKMRLSPVREFNSHAFNFKPEAIIEIVDPATVSSSAGLDIYIYIGLPFVLGFILSV
jgi:tRNA A58 N-methylase Trm61